MTTDAIYKKVEELNSLAGATFEDFQSTGDLAGLSTNLLTIQERADELRSISTRVSDILGEL
jgi:hypothetical protein